MVSTLLHFVWGIIFARTLNLNMLFFLFFTQILDVDFFIGYFKNDTKNHRKYFHNIFFITLLTLAGSLFFPFEIVIIALLVHILLDLIDEVGVPLFYPFSDKIFLIHKFAFNLPFPQKLIFDGNMYLSFFSFFILMISFIL